MTRRMRPTVKLAYVGRETGMPAAECGAAWMPAMLVAASLSVPVLTRTPTHSRSLSRLDSRLSSQRWRMLSLLHYLEHGKRSSSAALLQLPPHLCLPHFIPPLQAAVEDSSERSRFYSILHTTTAAVRTTTLVNPHCHHLYSTSSSSHCAPPRRSPHHRLVACILTPSAVPARFTGHDDEYARYMAALSAQQPAQRPAKQPRASSEEQEEYERRLLKKAATDHFLCYWYMLIRMSLGMDGLWRCCYPMRPYYPRARSTR